MSSAKITMSAEPSSSSLYERAEKAARMIRARANAEVSVALVLGSGRGAFADDLTHAVAIPYEEIPGFARSSVEDHAGKLVIGKSGDMATAVMQGGLHLYEV